jgi:tetratricopeptide (TPR) repeat protein
MRVKRQMSARWSDLARVRSSILRGGGAAVSANHGMLPARLARGLLVGAIVVASYTVAVAQSTRPPAESVPMQRLHQALSLAKNGDRQGAMTLTLQLLAGNPKFAPAIKLKGMLLEEAGQTSQAGAAYEEALKLVPDDPDLLLKTGIYELASGHRDQAIKLLKHCTKILPSDGDAHYYLSQAYHLNGQDELALAAIRQSVKVEPDNPSVWQKYGELLCGTGDCRTGLRWLLKTQQTDAALPRLDFDIAASDYQLMDFSGAADYAARALDSQPDDRKAIQLLAAANVKLARWQPAKAAYERVLGFDTNDVDALLGLGQCELELGNYSAAVERLQSGLRLDPTRLLAHFYLSRAYAAMDRPEASQHEARLHQLMMEQLTFVRSLESEQRESSIKMRAQQLLEAHQEQSAIQLYQRHFKGTSAGPADAYVFVGKIYLFMGETDDGVRCLHHALKLQPSVRGAHTYQGILALKSGDLNNAEKEFQTELANDPSYQTAIAEMGEVRYHQQRWSDAAELLAKSRTTTPELLYMLCDSYFHLGRVSEADLNAEAMAAYARNRPDVMRGLLELLVRNGQSDLAKRLSPNIAQ